MFHEDVIFKHGVNFSEQNQIRYLEQKNRKNSDEYMLKKKKKIKQPDNVNFLWLIFDAQLK